MVNINLMELLMKYGREAYNIGRKFLKCKWREEFFSCASLFLQHLNDKKKKEEKKYVPTHRVSQGITRGFINFMTMNEYCAQKKGIKFIDTMFLLLILGSLLWHSFRDNDVIAC